MFRILLVVYIFLSFISCKKKDNSSSRSSTPPVAAPALPSSCDAYSPTGNNLDLTGAEQKPLPAIDAAKLQVDSLTVTATPYTSGKDTYQTLAFEVTGKSTDDVNVISDYLQYKVCMQQSGANGQNCLCNNAIGACPKQDSNTALLNEFSTGDYQFGDPYYTAWEVPL